ncbi:hypothetical protein OF83DRAFT_1179036 [Amylostereum chailletii]|nr:hypothetical protein OF83DRAFT_1179036 [Amylostereum chailletii]
MCIILPYERVCEYICGAAQSDEASDRKDVDGDVEMKTPPSSPLSEMSSRDLEPEEKEERKPVLRSTRAVRSQSMDVTREPPPLLPAFLSRVHRKRCLSARSRAAAERERARSSEDDSPEWFCHTCLFGTGSDFGFDEGEEHSLSSFQVRDREFRKIWRKSHPPKQGKKTDDP